MLKSRKIVAVGLALTLPFVNVHAANADDNIETATPQSLSVTHAPKDTPAFAGGELHGTTTKKIDVDGYGTVKVTVNNDTGEMIERHPDGSVKQTNVRERARKLESVLKEATPQQRAELKAAQENRFSKDDICPYMVTAVGTLHSMSWTKVLALAAVEPEIAALAALGEAFFWTWVGTHCK